MLGAIKWSEFIELGLFFYFDSSWLQHGNVVGDLLRVSTNNQVIVKHIESCLY